VIVLVVLGSLAYVVYEQTTTQPKTVKLILDVSPGPSHAPYYYGLAQGTYKHNGINLTILAGTTVSAGLAALETGSADFAVSDPNNVVLFASRNNATDLKMVALTYEKNFAAVIYNNASIRSPADLNGKSGMMPNPATSALSGMFSLFARANGLNVSSMNVQYAPVSTAASYLLQGKVQFIVTTVQNLPSYNSLGASAGLKFGAFDMPSYGVTMAGFAIVTTQKMITDNPDIVKDFVKATMDSFVAAYSNPSQAVSDLVKSNPQINESTALAGFEADIQCCMLNPSGLSSPLQYGWMDSQLMQGTVSNVETAFGLGNSLNATSIYTNEYVQSP